MLLFDHPLLPFVWTLLFEALRACFYYFIVPNSDAIETRGNLYLIYPVWLGIGVISAYPVRMALALHSPLVYHKYAAKNLFYPLYDTALHPTEPRNAIIWKYYSLYWLVFLMQYPVCYVIDTNGMSVVERCQNGRIPDRTGIIEIGNFIGTGLVFLLLTSFAFFTVQYEKKRFAPLGLSPTYRYQLLFFTTSMWLLYLFLTSYFVINNDSALWGTGAFLVGSAILALCCLLLWRLKWTEKFEAEETYAQHASSEYLHDCVNLRGEEPKIVMALLIDELEGRKCPEAIKEKRK